MQLNVTESQWLANNGDIDGQRWLKGHGPMPADILVLGDHPYDDDVDAGAVFTGAPGQLLFSTLRKFGLADASIYFTNVVKYNPPNKRAVNAGDIKKCLPYLQSEFDKVNPKLVVCLGANALKACLGRGAMLTNYRGAIVEKEDLKIFTTYNPSQIIRNPQMLAAFESDISVLAQTYGKGTAVADKTDFVVIDTVEKLRLFKDFILSQESPVLALDAEWHGVTWMSPDRYIRTVQLGYDIGAAVVIEFTDANNAQVMDQPQEAWKLLKEILEHEKVSLIGHNVISDGEWLLSYGIDIRPRTIYDTMLGEHLINESGPFGLEMLTLKYTNMGRYDMDVQTWVKANKAVTAAGYGFVPRELLLPYGAKDVDATLRIAQKQMPLLADAFKANGQYPSLWEIEMGAQQTIYEMELNGMVVDPVRLDDLIQAYNKKAIALESTVKSAAQQYGMPDFNYNAVMQVRAMLFEKLGLQPVKDTKGKQWQATAPWQSTLKNIGKPSTDKNTLEILQDSHPFVKLLLNMRRIGTAVKYFLRDDEEAEETPNSEAEKEETQNQSGGGIKAKIWPDGKLHAHFSQLTETGRLRHSKPNVANWPKKAEGYMADIFGGKDKVPPLIRTIIVPSPGYVMMEADFEQAELYVLASLSRDKTMLEALNTPGKDLHDLTAITAFKLRVLGPDGQPVNEQELLSLARQDKKQFEELIKTFMYVDQRDKCMSRKEFKETIRVSAKNLEVRLTPN